MNEMNAYAIIGISDMWGEMSYASEQASKKLEPHLTPLSKKRLKNNNNIQPRQKDAWMDKQYA